MKKKYIAPDIIMVMMKHDMGILCGSVLSDVGIGYGGVDNLGEFEADTREATLMDSDELKEWNE